MLIQFSKRILFFVIVLLAIMIWASPSLAQIIEDQGYASWYNRGAHGDMTASGERYDHAALTAAHPYLPFDSMVRVTRLDDDRSVVVRINDRMATGPGHIIDLSGAAASKLGLLDANVARVRIDLERPSDLLQVRERLARQRKARDEEPITLAVEASGRRSGTSERITVSSSTDRTSVDQRRQRAESTPVTRVEASERYTLQVGVFSSRPAAASFAGELDNVWIREVDDNGGTLYRVYYDRFSQEEPARVAQKNLRNQGFDSFLREIL